MVKFSTAGILGVLIFSPWGSSQSFADPIVRKPIKIDHLHVDYGNKVGQGQVQYMTYHFNTMSLDHNNLTAQLEMKGDTLSISDGTTKFSVSKVLDFINYFDSIRAEDLNFHMENSFFSGTLPKSFLGISGKQYLLEQFAVACGTTDRDVMNNDDTLLFIIEICLGKGKVKFDEMSFPSNTFLAAFANSVFTEAISEKAGEKISVDRIKNLSLEVDDHEFTAHAKVRIKFDLGVHASGRVSYEAEKSRYKVELKSASLGFIPIRWLIYRAIRNLNDPSVTVEEPSIYIAYQKPFPQDTRKIVKPFK